MVTIFEKFKQGISKTKSQVFDRITDVLTFHRKIDDALFDEIEEILISGDVGVDTTLELLENVKKQAKRQKVETSDQLLNIFKEEIIKLFPPQTEASSTDKKPFVILMVGVNGTGKTTTIAKLAYRFQQKGKKVLLVAGDTFRAAAIEQLQAWADRIHADIIKHQSGSDPAAVAYDAMNAAVARQMDVVIIDTAGRLHTKKNLMEELKKIKRVIQKVIPDAPHEVYLVLDATIGQNAFNQAREFASAVGVTGLILTKLDGTAKGGAIIGIAHQLNLPVAYVGLGEKLDDLEVFDPEIFVNGLFETTTTVKEPHESK